MRQRDPDDRGYRLNDTGVLMNYASTNENMSPLTGDAYLKYGVPRVRGEGAEVINAILTTCTCNARVHLSVFLLFAVCP